mmetsp:Transcript_41689/g.95684  ORF Transcript_41689/g.95684 Transcript_41689/m.95684 type:complete len:249 (+) Transcript_41689:1-747(+)
MDCQSGRSCSRSRRKESAALPHILKSFLCRCVASSTSSLLAIVPVPVFPATPVAFRRISRASMSPSSGNFLLLSSSTAVALISDLCTSLMSMPFFLSKAFFMSTRKTSSVVTSSPCSRASPPMQQKSMVGTPITKSNTNPTKTAPCISWLMEGNAQLISTCVGPSGFPQRSKLYLAVGSVSTSYAFLTSMNLSAFPVGLSGWYCKLSRRKAFLTSEEVLPLRNSKMRCGSKFWYILLVASTCVTCTVM